ncbi:MAG TPA: ferritin family protein [bacterium]|jgi:rubrerythrin|nr:ferritin family protein [Dictyoglomota bacterium]HHV82021.1 ferritin family protein [bacterium]HOK29370.1 ferritin family protein [bacterium]HOL54768.1 ferritin family protein [bacterium]HON72132.1 ferritin family protein [bacterium]
MNKNYSIEEILEIAVKIEENGVLFYRTLAEQTRDKRIEELFRFLEGEEREHISVFKNIYENLTKKTFEKAFSEEEANMYLHALIENRIFKKPEEIISTVSRNDGLSAVDIAIQVEKDTILYYYEILENLTGKEKDLVKELINQEKTHVYRLTTLKNTLRG